MDGETRMTKLPARQKAALRAIAARVRSFADQAYYQAYGPREPDPEAAPAFDRTDADLYLAATEMALSRIADLGFRVATLNQTINFWIRYGQPAKRTYVLAALAQLKHEIVTEIERRIKEAEAK